MTQSLTVPVSGFHCQKTKGEKQLDIQQKQPVMSDTACHGLESANSQKWNTFKDRYEEISRGKDESELVIVDCRAVLNALETKIEIRDCSGTTLRIY